ncbi:MAG: hypothetical protein AB7H88_05925 [Vicinamibacterales bacterium]
MVIIEDSHWPLVVVGVADGPGTPIPNQAQALARFESDEPRLLTLVAGGIGAKALASLDELLRWVAARRRGGRGSAAALAWVIPDAMARAAVDSLLALEGHRMLGCPAATFTNPHSALHWLGKLGEGAGSPSVRPSPVGPKAQAALHHERSWQ